MKPVTRAIETLANNIWFGVIIALPQCEFIHSMSVMYDFSCGWVIL